MINAADAAAARARAVSRTDTDEDADRTQPCVQTKPSLRYPADGRRTGVAQGAALFALRPQLALAPALPDRLGDLAHPEALLFRQCGG